MPDAIHDEALERRHRDPIACGDGHVVEPEPERVQSGQARRAAARQRAERPLLPMGKEARRRGEQLHAAPVQAERRLPAACNEGGHQWQSESEAIIQFGAPPATSIAPSALKYSADKPCGPATSLLPPTTAPSSSAPSAPSSSSSLLAAWSAVVGCGPGPPDAVPTMAPAAAAAPEAPLRAAATDGTHRSSGPPAAPEPPQPPSDRPSCAARSRECSSASGAALSRRPSLMRRAASAATTSRSDRASIGW